MKGGGENLNKKRRANQEKNEARGKWKERKISVVQIPAAKVKSEYTQPQQVHDRHSKLGNIRAIRSVYALSSNVKPT